MSDPLVQFGVDRVAHYPDLLPGARRIGLVTNQAARLAHDVALLGRVALLRAGLPVVHLFSPEHGLSAAGEDGAPMRDAVDPATGLAITSLYGDRFVPPDATLRALDLILFDIPDVGARFYTYAWTLSHVLEACARVRVPLVVLDRPNPLGGDLDTAEGPMLDEARCASFIGRWTLPVRHALTLGELALHWAMTRVRDAQVDVITCAGWRREMLWPDLQLPWVPTSPAMRSFDSALTYPGLALFEATNLSVGRGTDTPFQRIGAPWLDPRRVIDAVEHAAYWGVRLHSDHFTPAAPPYRDEPCEAIRVEVVDPRRLRPVALGLTLMAAVMHRHPSRFEWTAYPTAANPSGQHHFERLIGRETIAARLRVSEGPVPTAEIQHWTAVPGWRRTVRDALLYR